MEKGLDRRAFLKLSAATTVSGALSFVGASSLMDQSPSNLHYLKRFYQAVESKRKQRAVAEPLFNHYVDQKLNLGRINFLLYVYGETHEPPQIERAVIGSQTIISVDTNSHSIDEISWTHDLRAPEIERHLKQEGRYDGIFKRVDQAYGFGGFPLMRQTIEAATGLAVDFQLAAGDSIIVDLVDKAASGIRVTNPKSFTAYKIYLQGKPYPEKFFTKGAQELDGIRALQYIKSVPKEDPDPVIEHNRRKSLVMDALRQKLAKPASLLQLIPTIKENLDNRVVEVDGVTRNLLFTDRSLLSGAEILRYLVSGGKIDQLIPKSRRKIYLVDWAHGDGGMQWVTANAAQNSISKRDLELGVYPPKIGAEVPFDHRMNFLPDPYAEDLIEGYWLPLRKRVAELLSSPLPAMVTSN